VPSPCARHRPSPASCTRSCRWIHPQWVPRPGATENVKCRRHARSSGLGPIEGKDDACVSLRKDRCFLSPEPRFYPLGQMFAFSRVRASSLQIPAFEDSAARRSHSRRFWVLEHVPSLFSSETALSSRTGRAWDTTRVSAPTGRPRTRSHRQATHRATERKALRTHGRARSFFGPRDISRYNCSSKRR
jgi:hypothetical protein